MRSCTACLRATDHHPSPMGQGACDRCGKLDNATWLLPDPPPRSDLPTFPDPDPRRRVVSIAEGELGDQDPDRYWQKVSPSLAGRPHDVSWCGGFALWCLTEALPACADWSWEPGVGFVYRYSMPQVTEPEPGDVAYFRTLGGREIHHYAIVERADGGRIYTIDGNQGVRPVERVERRSRSLGTLTTVFSIREVL